MTNGLNVGRASWGSDLSSALYKDARLAISDLQRGGDQKIADSFERASDNRTTVLEDTYVPELRLTVGEGTTFDFDATTTDKIILKDEHTGSVETFVQTAGTKPRVSLLGYNFGRTDCQFLEHKIESEANGMVYTRSIFNEDSTQADFIIRNI